MPSRWLVPLKGAPVPQVPVEAAHAVVSRWLDEDHKANVKPYALAPPRSVDGQVVLEVRLLEDSLAVRLAAHAAPAVPVRLGRHWLAVAGMPVLDMACSWSELVGDHGRRAWEVDYRSPATFRRAPGPARGPRRRAC